jgi:hypothetical protein
MRRTGLLQLGLLCFFLASDLTEWRWFEVAPQSGDAEVGQLDVLPIAMRFKAQINETIELPPTLDCHDHELPTSRELVRPDFYRLSSATLFRVAIIHSHTSLQL